MMAVLHDLQRLLPTVSKPARYTGSEWNSIRKEWSAVSIRLALAFPDVYEVGMSNLGMAILYELVNAQPDMLAERVYAPWPDMAGAMRQANLPLFSLESRRPISEFDIIGFSLQYELNYTNVLEMLDLAGVPLLAAERGPEHPVVIAGGTCTHNPEPLSDFIDLFVVGDGEEALLELLRLYVEWRGEDAPKADGKVWFLRRAARLAGVYVPSLYRVDYLGDRISSITPIDDRVPQQVLRRIVDPLPPPPVRPVVPYLETIHDRAMIEIMRGCGRGCRFCQAGVVYRPVRERQPREVLQAVDALLANTGHEEVSLVSLSSSDYSAIELLVTELNERHGQDRISISLPSLRTDAFSVGLARLVQHTRKGGLTFAPEAGSERLRRVINKGVTRDDLMRTAEAAFSSGWLRIKLYFMIGLPTEELEDVLAISDLTREVLAVGTRWQKGKAQLSVSVNTFVPKAHTPFQWEPLVDPRTVAERLGALKRSLPQRRVHLSWSDERNTWLEALLARGDRRMGMVVRRAWELGARFDAWSELMNIEAWKEALSQCDVDPEAVLRFMGGRERILPWSHIDCGVSADFLWEERQRSLSGETSTGCRDGCLDCGVRASYGLPECPILLRPDPA